MKEECWLKDKGINIVDEPNVSTLFMVYCDTHNVAESLWLVNSGCSNRMIGMKKLSRELDETYKIKIKLGDNKEMQVEEKGIVAMEISQGKVKIIREV